MDLSAGIYRHARCVRVVSIALTSIGQGWASGSVPKASGFRVQGLGFGDACCFWACALCLRGLFRVEGLGFSAFLSVGSLSVGPLFVLVLTTPHKRAIVGVETLNPQPSTPRTILGVQP